MSAEGAGREGLQVIHQEADLDEVMRCYASGFKVDVRRCEFFIDTHKRRVVFRLTVNPEPDPLSIPAAPGLNPDDALCIHGVVTTKEDCLACDEERWCGCGDALKPGETECWICASLKD